MSIIDIKKLSLFSFGSDPKLVKLVETLFKENRKLQEESREKDRMNFEDKSKIKELELQIETLEQKLKLRK